MRLALVLAVTAAIVGEAAADPVALPAAADELVQQLEAALGGVGDVEVEFEQVVVNKAFGRTTRRSVTACFDGRGGARFEYGERSDTARSLYVIDGRQVWAMYPARKIWQRKPLPPGFRTRALQLLAEGRATLEMTASYVAHDDQTAELALVPRVVGTGPAVVSTTLRIRRQPLAVVELAMTSAHGDVTTYRVRRWRRVTHDPRRFRFDERAAAAQGFTRRGLP